MVLIVIGVSVMGDIARKRHLPSILIPPTLHHKYKNNIAPQPFAVFTQAHSGSIPLGTVQRCQLLDVFASMLPESARLAHQQSLLQRRHTRHMPPHILKQVCA